ncbi:4'-phosphopantetheinyl transferase family protein [Desulfovibrio inopinatus]|uniref:4'-phosphopantetheinyl transferase family protein n=1 Tax=Desulfovibrio inopinatus TaxID=102109 RepID=UPI00042923C9|nr:4'-phosphopantetheinyl transferase superfamily protein [Desulfovibrio inopinatus]
MDMKRFRVSPDKNESVDVLFFRLNGEWGEHDLKSFLSCLDPTERQHALERKGCIQTRYIRAHGGLRHILSAAVSLPPEEIAYVYNHYGKPAIKSGNIFFNMSHSDQFCMVGLSNRYAIGVDVQKHVPLDNIRALAKEVFSSEECRLLERTLPKQRHITFFNMWARKEALLKYFGIGMAERPWDWTVRPRGRREASSIYMGEKKLPIKLYSGNVQGVLSWGIAWGPLKISSCQHSCV